MNPFPTLSLPSLLAPLLAAPALALAAAPAPPPAALPAPDRGPASLTFYSENDKYFAGTDQAYTNGFKISYLSGRLDTLEGPPALAPVRALARQLARFVPAGESYRAGFSLGQNIYTPVDTQAAAYQPGDRPYAAWLYVGAAAHFVRPEDAHHSARLDIFELNLGLVGPSALGEDVQNGFHELIQVDRARGWDNQIRDEPGVNLVYERRHRLSTYTPDSRLGWGLDLIPHAGFSLGNIFTYANAGAELRFGHNLPADFGSNLIRPSGDSAPARRPPLGFFVFGAFDARAVARDITLDGNTFKDSPDVDRENLVADLYAGVGLSTPWAQLRYAQAFRTKEFAGQRDSQVFGSLSATFYF
jgi:lipid A 3-O-deacylase